MATIKSTLELALPDIFYEDPEPVEDHMHQEPTISFLVFTLRTWFESRQDVFVSAGGFVFYNEANGNDRVAPDCYIALDVAPDFVFQFPNFFVWEVGKPPDFVLEVASPSTAQNDLGRKRALYARLGIPEYWRVDPTGGELYGAPLTGERLVDGEYVPFPVRVSADGSISSRSEALNLDFHWDGERFNIIDPVTGNTLDLRETLRAESRAREEAESQASAARRAQQEAEFQAETERRARLESESRAEERIRALTEEVERLRQQRG